MAKHVHIKLTMQQTLKVKQRRPVPQCSCILVAENGTVFSAPELRLDIFVAIRAHASPRSGFE